MAGALGLRKPTDDRHRALYPLTAATIPDIPTPVAIGINWYHGFDAPVLKNGSYWIGLGTDWSSVRGGHAVCLKPPALRDLPEWWRFYDQGNEGACVAFAVSRMMTLLNRKRYAAMPLYAEAQNVDEFTDTPPEEGTTVRAVCDVARREGLWLAHKAGATGPVLSEGIDTNRWAGSVSEIAACLSPGDAGQSVLNRGYVELLNSWGAFYPHTARLPLEALNRLIFMEDGEAAVVTDRR
jgi:hypothetical protein